MDVTVLIFDSVVKLPPEARGAVVIGGSHSAVYAAYMSAKYGCRAAIHHDAGIGKDEAGIGGLAYADTLGMAMAAVATASARIGDGQDLHRHGIISRANALATSCGIAPGMSCREAAELLKRAPWPHAAPPPKGEDRHWVDGIACIDSASLFETQDRDKVVATGSHCALNSGQATAPFRPRLAFYNDAGPGIDRGACWASLCWKRRESPASPWRRCRRASATVARLCRTERSPRPMRLHTGSARRWGRRPLPWRAQWPKRLPDRIREN